VATPNWANETMWTADNLPILRGMNSESVDLIYLDPPFNSSHDYAAPIGSKAAGAAFKDTWTLSDIDLAWLLDFEKNNPKITRFIQAVDSDSDKSYLIYMVPRLSELRRILKPTGSIYLHCDPTMSHYLKLLMDLVFGRKMFRNEIIWHYQTGGVGKKWFGRKHDTILFYAKSEDYFIDLEQVREKRTPEVLRRLSTGNESATRATTRDRLPFDVWIIQALNAMSKERTGYPTQKPLALLDRIIKASSNEGDVVLDPFCGCATACVAAHNLNRQWMGIDISPKAYELVRDRITTGGGGYSTISPNVLTSRNALILAKYRSTIAKKTRRRCTANRKGYATGAGNSFSSRI